GYAQEFPTKPMTLVVPFSAGGSNDVVARYVAQGLSALFGQPMVVENRPGGGTSVGAMHVARAKPDGHTLLLASSSYATNAASRTDLPFDPVKDLVPVGIAGNGDVMVLGSAKLNVRSLQELAKKAKEGKLFFGTTGAGGFMHFYGEMLNDALGVSMTPVPYPGGSEAYLDLVANRVDVTVGAVAGMLAAVQSGAVPLAILGKDRALALPNVPTAAEAGYPNALADNYWTIFAPAGTPPATVQKLHDGIQKVMSSAEGKAFLAKLDARPVDMSPADLEKKLIDSIEYWKGLAKKMGLIKG
ncbi:tripartite tricarboxylate transporter substrate binding protein, partial [Rhizobium sp. PP-F2F-G48]|uniref:Bug family tripartite tricarboxylate transporter substrate binding protein n=1 Tax=Rhizobium sp. PP-F2F-G48 TaxID=2135651 RepID=UPI001404EA3C